MERGYYSPPPSRAKGKTKYSPLEDNSKKLNELLDADDDDDDNVEELRELPTKSENPAPPPRRERIYNRRPSRGGADDNDEGRAARTVADSDNTSSVNNNNSSSTTDAPGPGRRRATSRLQGLGNQYSAQPGNGGTLRDRGEREASLTTTQPEQKPPTQPDTSTLRKNSRGKPEPATEPGSTSTIRKRIEMRAETPTSGTRTPGTTLASKEDPEKPLNNFSSFTVAITGQIESCDSLHDNLYCKYTFVFGSDWSVTSGVQHGLSQYSKKSLNMNNLICVWNFPIDITFQSTNVYGWPQVAISVYGPDWMGNDVIRGYGTFMVPCYPGRYVRYVRLFAPLQTSLMNELLSYFNGLRTEFNDTKFVCKGEGRQVARVRSDGTVKVSINVMTKNMAKFGFTEEAAKNEPIIF